ncbi:serine hydrolase [Haliscomenobacter hydrossis]|uniref:Beta-lactamase n=1 Tax=Haliscomenobacter hydrossis (strain ATCC 27775 / DSM 1100 / LMG 10767 / O) TaxID=760192 RepID=F4L619_HALH1|nr:serine hydrolase [Haliscomenobacter hydrossis]AEE53079.1 beta-lactamase [Haliscomenobacter hydrossis DSM 1100]
MKNTFFLFVISLFCQTLFAQNLNSQIQEFDTYAAKAMAAWQMPGMAVAIVKDGKVIFKKGYGVRELGATNAVNTQTQFSCASTTKAMTAVCMAILVDEGKVNWDDHVVKYLPEFQLYDPHVTRELRIRDLFTHNSGVGNADFLWSIMNVSSEEVLRKMQQVEPSYSLRSSFIYQNIFYLAAGKVIEKISGQKWEYFIQARIFKPLGMTNTYPTLQSTPTANLSKPHYRVNGVIKVIAATSADQIGPAGSVHSCIDDMSKWMTCMLDSSKYAGGRLLEPHTWAELFRPQVLVPASEFYPTMQLIKPNWTSYALGWFQHDYKGKKINYHTGSLAGEIAMHAQLPEAKLGIYVFGNFDHAEVRHALVYKTFDLFALGGTRDWNAEFLTLYQGILAQNDKAEAEFKAKQIPYTQPTKRLTEYVGKYTHPLYGEAVVVLDDNKLVVTLNQFISAKLGHWHYDTFRGPYVQDWYGQAMGTFSLNMEGKVEKLTYEGMEFVRFN